jgi:cell division protein FtsA
VKRKEQIICGLDVGTQKTCLVVARSYPNGKLEVVGSGFAISCGLTKGVIVNSAEVVNSIRRALEDLQLRFNSSVSSVVAGISGYHIKSHIFRGAVPVQGKHSEITVRDVQNALRAAQSIPLSPERDIIHLIPKDFVVNSRGGITNPVGLTGSQLDVDLHVISCDAALNQSLINAANKAQIEVRRTVIQSIASGEAVLTPEEKEAGTVVIDIGGGTTDIAVFVNNSIHYASVIPVGGEHFTQDLVAGLRSSRKEAERIKTELGNVLPELIAEDEMVAVEGLGMRGTYDFPRKKICVYLRARGAELLDLVKKDLVDSGLNGRLIAGAVLTGGGSLMEGILELAENILEMPVRRGFPRGFQGRTEEMAHPSYACALGLTIVEAQKIAQQDIQDNSTRMTSLMDRILSWIEK